MGLQISVAHSVSCEKLLSYLLGKYTRDPLSCTALAMSAVTCISVDSQKSDIAIF